MSISKSVFGKLDNGTVIDLYTITNKSGASVSLQTLGAGIQSIKVPDKNGNLADVVLGFDNPQAYKNPDNGYQGLVVGRWANRIRDAKFTFEGVEYNTPKNQGTWTLHGGGRFSFTPWEVDDTNDNGVTFKRFSPDGEDGFGGNFTRFGLAQAAKRELDPRKRLLCQIVEHVALVLRLVEGLFEDVLLPCPLDAGVVAGGDIAAAQDIGALKELVEFQIAVAVDAGVGGDAVLVGVDEAVDDAGGEFVLEVENIKRKVQTAGDAPCVLRVVERAAGMALGDARVLVVIELHHAADAVVARVGQKLCRHAGIHAAGHGDEHLLSSHWQPETPAWR